MAKLNFLGGKFEAFDDSDAKLSGGKAHFYEPGTSTDKDTYTTSALTVANANPVILDSSGRATIWLKNEDYKVVLKDSNDVTIYTEDNINPATTSSASNFSLQDNSSFEDGVDSSGFPLSWTTTEWGTVEVVTDDQSHSASAVKMTSTGSGGGFIQSENFIEVDENRLYSLHWSMKSSVADVRNLVQVKWYNSAQTSISTEILFDESTANPTSWTAKDYQANPPANARYAKLEFYGCHSSDSTPGNVLYDGILFQRHFTLPEAIELIFNDDAATVGPTFKMYRNSASPADNDIIGKIFFEGNDDGGNRTEYASLTTTILDVTDATEDAKAVLALMQGGSSTDVLQIGPGVQIGSPTGGDPGAGGINASDVQVAGVTVLTDTTDSVDGTNIANSSISQGELNTSTTSTAQSSSVAGDTNTTIALTGGTYQWTTISADNPSTESYGFGNGNTSAGTYGFFNNNTGTISVYTDGRYVTASPPYSTADGDIPLFVYVEVEKGSGDILGVSICEDPIWAYHGPTNIAAARVDKASGRKYRKVHQIEAELGEAKVKRDLIKAIRSGDRASVDRIRERKAIEKMVEIEITSDYKNSDMHTHPHPYMYNKPRNSEHILLDPQETLDLYDLHCCGDNVLKLVEDKIIKIDNTPLDRIVPIGMKAYGFKF